MCDSINDTLKLLQQDKARFTFYILQHLRTLDDILKCCICFELFDKPIKTNCGHTFCKSCIYKHRTYYTSEKITPCPICMKPLADFETFSLHVKYEELVTFVKEILEDTRNFQADIEEPPNFQSILQKIEQNTSEEEVKLSNEMPNFESDSRYKSILNARKFLISTSGKVFLSENVGASSPNEPVDNIKTIPQMSTSQAEVNPFDQLLNESKRLKQIKTYESKKTPRKEIVTTEIEKTIKNRKRLKNSKTLEWLQDTRNNFETLPTQSTTTNLKETIPKFDLPSISQDPKLEFTSKVNKTDQSKTRRLTRSMGGFSKVNQAKTRERHSIAACDNLSIPISIEQFSSDEIKTVTKGLQELEVQCLNNIDEMLLEVSMNKKTTKILKSEKKKKVQDMSNSNLSKRTKKSKDTLDTSSSLNKFKEMKKVISKTERKLSKLPVVVNSGPTLCKMVTSATSALKVIDQPVVIIEKCHLSNYEPVASGSKRKMDVMEKCNFTKPSNKTLTRIDYVNKDDELQNSPKSKTPNRKFSKNEKSKRTPGLKIKSSKNKTEAEQTKEESIENHKKKHDSDNAKSNGNNLTQSMNETVRRVVNTSNDDDDIFKVITQHLDPAELIINDVGSSAPKRTEADQTKEESVENHKKKHESDNDESNRNKLIQSMNETVGRVVNTSDDDNDIFKLLTQPLIIEPNELIVNCDEPHKELEKLDLPQQLNETMKIITSTVGILKNYSSQLKPKAKEYVSNFINDTLKAINASLHPDQDIFVKTDSPVPHIVRLINLAIQTDLSIPSLENYYTEMGIQTDSNSPRRGLYISSTDMFNTPSVTDAEVQTDFLPCSNCNLQMISSVTKGSERCILSESFDNIQFETQEIIKGKRNLELLHLRPRTSSSNKASTIENRACPDVTSPTCKPTKCTSKRLRTQNSSDDMFAKDDDFDNVQFDTQEILKGKYNLEVQSTSNKNCDVETSTLSNTKSPRRTSKRLCKSNLSDQLLEKDDGFDNIQFIKTQDFLKGKHNLKVQSPPASPAHKSPRRTSKRLRKQSSAKDDNFEMEIVRSQPTFKEYLQPGTPPSSNKKSDVGFPASNPVRRASKRLRTQNTPEEELLPKDIKRNKYINEDASLQFLSDEIESSNHPIEFNDSDSSKYEECLNNVLKKYEQENISKSSQKISQAISKTQNAIRECNGIIKEACSEAIRIENSENLDKTVKYSKHRPSPITLSILQAEFSKDFDNASKIVKTSEIPKEVLQSEKVKSIEKEVLCNLGDNFEEVDMSLENKANDASESTNFESLPRNAAVHKKSNNGDNIVILQNAVISKGIDAALIEELNKSFDDVFLSDSDVVETTPQKNKIVSCEELLSQAYYNPVAPVVLPPLVEDSPDVISSLDLPLLTCFDKTFAPPPEFQDMGNPEVLINLEESQDVTLKPDSDSVQIVQDSRPILSSVTPDLFMGAHNMITSTPLEASQIISHSLSLSPIKPTYQEPRKLQNPIDAAHNSMMSPLNIVKSQNNFQPRNLRPLGSSTPKQKSILSFIKTKKPCVTCTRLSKPEVAMIRALEEKNLFTYSVNFNSSVTHLIVSVDEQQCICDHTMKYVSAVAAGIWIVGFNWIQECVNRDQIVPEEQFEVLDISGFDGPKQSRLNRNSNPLFRGYKIYISPPFQAVVERDMEDVIINLGGEVVQSINDLLKKNGKICIIIAEAKSKRDFEMYNSWLEKFKVITVEMEWLSRSVGQYEIVNFRHFALCSDETISDLGYPPELTSNLPFNSRSALSNV